MDRARGTSEQQERLAALDAKDAELTRARDKTRDRGEKELVRAELKAVRNEANALREKALVDYQAWVSSGGAAAASHHVEQSLPAKEFTVRAFINGPKEQAQSVRDFLKQIDLAKLKGLLP